MVTLTPKEQLNFDRVDHFHLYVTDRDKAETWYQENLGFTRVKALEQWVAEGPLTIANGDIHLALFSNKPPQKSAIAFGVSAPLFIKWQKHLTERNIKILVMDHQLSWSIYFSDPDGNPFEITSFEYNALTELLNQC